MFFSVVIDRDFKHRRRERQRRREIVRENPNVTLRMSGGKYLDVPDVRKLRLALPENVSNISHILPPFRPEKMIFLILLVRVEFLFYSFRNYNNFISRLFQNRKLVRLVTMPAKLEMTSESDSNYRCFSLASV